MAQAAELQQWWHHYFSLVILRGVKQYFTVVGQAWFVCFMRYQQYFSYIMVVIWITRWEGEIPSLLLLTQGIFNFPPHVGMVWEELAFDDTELYTAVEIPNWQREWHEESNYQPTD